MQGQANPEEDRLANALRESDILAAENERLRLEVRETAEKYQAMRSSLSWKLTAPLRIVLDWAIEIRKRLGLDADGSGLKDPLEMTAENYRKWVEQFDRLTEADRRSIRAAISKLSSGPTFSLLLTVTDPDAGLLRATLQSIRRQIYGKWELCVVDDASSAPHVARTLANSGDDPRVRIARRDRRGGTATAGNEALAMAKGDFVGFLEAGDVLGETALFEIASEIDAHPEAAVVYTDEDSLDARGERVNPKFRTGWNPDLLLSQNYLGRITVFKREIVTTIGGLRGEFAGDACYYDLALRATAGAGRVSHIPAVLCHWSGNGEGSDDAEGMVRAARDFLGDRATAVEAIKGGHRIHWRVPPETSVTVIIPTRDRAELLEQCVKGLLERTKFPLIDVIVVDNASREERTRQLFTKFESLAKVRVIAYPGEFNWSAMNNAGAAAGGGEVLLFLNNDTDVIEENWLEELVSHAARPEIGAAGAKLLYPDWTVQHGGIWLGPGVFARHALRLSKREDDGYLGQLSLTRDLSAVTGACLAMRRQVFAESGGFDESFPVSYSDLDLCLRLIQKGYRIVWTPHAELLHLESASRGSSEWRWRKEEADRDRFVDRWRNEIDNDPFFNPNLDLIGEEKLALAFPPRRERAWRG